MKFSVHEVDQPLTVREMKICPALTPEQYLQKHTRMRLAIVSRSFSRRTFEGSVCGTVEVESTSR
jgi:hypothetical protein